MTHLLWDAGCKCQLKREFIIIIPLSPSSDLHCPSAQESSFDPRTSENIAPNRASSERGTRATRITLTHSCVSWLIPLPSCSPPLFYPSTFGVQERLNNDQESRKTLTHSFLLRSVTATTVFGHCETTPSIWVNEAFISKQKISLEKKRKWFCEGVCYTWSNR